MSSLGSEQGACPLWRTQDSQGGVPRKAWPSRVLQAPHRSPISAPSSSAHDPAALLLLGHRNRLCFFYFLIDLTLNPREIYFL